MTIRFPKYSVDGSAQVDVFISGVRAHREVVDDWVKKWWSQNREWIRVWSSDGEETTERLLLDTDFVRPFEVRWEIGETLVIKVEVTKGSQRWRDWIAKFGSEFCAAFPPAALNRMES